MAITAFAGTGGGVLAALLRLSSEQLLGQAVGDAGRTLASLAGGTGAFRVALLDSLGGALAALGTAADDRTSGLVGLVVLLLLPAGGPAWAGIVPVGVVLAGARTCARSTHVGAHQRVGAGRNARTPHATDDGPVTLRILVVDDNDDFRQVARRVLTADGLEVAGTAATGAEALRAVPDLRPQVVLVDVHLGTESGFDVARRIASTGAAPAVVMMSTRSEEELAESIARSPVAGFVAKQRLSGEAVRAVLLAGDA